jgi:phosphonate transport system ATP-binding protein
VIELERLAKSFPGGVQALDGVSLTIAPGEFVALLGPSGAGKSTLLRCINGLVGDFEGAVRVDGVPVRPGSDLRAVRRQVAMVFQQFNLVRRISVLENVLCGRLAHTSALLSSLRLFTADDVGMALEALERVGLADKAHVRADQLSGGQQQRVGIARALVQRPRAILADEPVASLDPVSSRRVLELLAEINRRDGVTLVTSLHDPRLAIEFGRRIVGLSHGRLVFDRPAAEVTPLDVSQIYERPVDLAEGAGAEGVLVVAGA